MVLGAVLLFQSDGTIERLGDARFRHVETIVGLAYAPDGNTLTGRGKTGIVRTWNALDGGLVDERRGPRALAAHGDLRAVAEGPDVVLRSISAELRRFRADAEFVYAASFSPDGSRLVTGGGDRIVRMWDVASGNLLRTFEGNREYPISVALSPDGRFVATGGEDEFVRVWDAATARLKWAVQAHPRWVNVVVFSPDGAVLASGGDESRIKLWNVETGAPSEEFDAPDRVVEALAFSPDGGTLAVGGPRRVVALWDTRRASFREPMSANAGPIASLDVSPDGEFVATGGVDGQVVLWRGSAGERIGRHDEPVSRVAFIEGGRLLVSTAGDAVEVWDVRRRIAASLEPAPSVDSVFRLSMDGRQRAEADDFKISVWSLDLPTTRRELRTPARTPWSVGSHIRSLAFDPTGDRLVAAFSRDDWSWPNDWLTIWNRRDAEAIANWNVDAGGITDVDVAPDGQFAVTASSDRTHRIWELATGQEVYRLDGGGPAVRYRRDGAIVSSMADATLRIWRSVARTPWRGFDAHWDDLGSTDAARAFDARIHLSGHAEAVAARLRPHLEAVRRLLRELDDEDIVVRDRAMETLAEYGEFAAPELRTAPSLEARARSRWLLQEFRPGPLRLLRARALCETGEPEN